MNKPAGDTAVGSLGERAVALLPWLALLAATIGAILYANHYASVVPWWDYWSLAPQLAGEEPITLAWLWAPNNEHRLPLVKLLLVPLGRLTLDVRTPIYINIALMAAAAAMCIALARRLRGRTTLSDAAFPLLWLHVGHYVTFLLAFQLQHVLSAVLAVALLGIVVMTLTPRDQSETPSAPQPMKLWHVLLAIALLLLLPLTGGNGMVTAPPLAIGLVISVWLARRAASSTDGQAASGKPEGDSPKRAALATASLGALLAIALCVLIFTQQPASPRGLSPLGPAAGTALQFLCSGFGAAAQQSWPSSAIAVGLGVLVAIGVLLMRVRGARHRPINRASAVMLLALLFALLALAAAVGLSRGGDWPNAGFQRRYFVLAVPFAAALLLVIAMGRSALSRSIEWALLVSVALAFGINTNDGLAQAKHYQSALEPLRHDLAIGTETEIAAAKHAVRLGLGTEAVAAKRIALLRDAGYLPSGNPDTLQGEARLAYEIDKLRFSLTKAIIGIGQAEDRSLARKHLRDITRSVHSEQIARPASIALGMLLVDAGEPGQIGQAGGGAEMFQNALVDARGNRALSALAKRGLGRIAMARGDWKQAERWLRSAQQSEPGLPAMDLAWLLATAGDSNGGAALRNGQAAVQLAQFAGRHAQAVVKRGGPQAEDAGLSAALVLETLAAAFAETGNFEQAKAAIARSLATAAKAKAPASLIEAIKARQAMYEQGKPYRQAARAQDSNAQHNNRDGRRHTARALRELLGVLVQGG